MVSTVVEPLAFPGFLTLSLTLLVLVSRTIGVIGFSKEVESSCEGGVVGGCGGGVLEHGETRCW